MEEFLHRRTRQVRLSLYKSLGSDSARLIDREMARIEEMTRLGKSNTEILEWFRHNTRLQRVTVKRFDDHLPLSLTPTPFLRKQHRHTPVVQPFNRRLQHLQEAGRSMRHGWDYYAKIDELKALEAAKRDQVQRKQLEEERLKMKQQAAQEQRRCLEQQLAEKQRRLREAQQQDQDYRKQLEVRAHQQWDLEARAVVRAAEARKRYADSLRQQLRMQHLARKDFARLRDLGQELLKEEYH